MHGAHQNGSSLPHPSKIDFARTPFVAIWEITRACDLACRHCRAEAIPQALPGQLTKKEGLDLLQDLAEMGTPICVLSGGDPAKRTDLCDLVEHGNRLGMRMATIPAATPLLTRALVKSLKDAGLAQMALSLDGPTAEVHDRFRGVLGAFDLTLHGARYAREVGLPLQINTTFSAYNRQHFESMAELVLSLGVVFWEVFFLVPMGRGRALGQLNAEEFECLFEQLARFARRVDFIVKITEGPHYRRYLLQERSRARTISSESKSPGSGAYPKGGQLPSHMTRDFGPGGSIGLAPKGVNSGNGFVFVNYRGDIYPSGFLPLSCGNVRSDSIGEVYRSHHVFRELRDPDLLKGKCGSCEFRHVCGGSRARAYALTGDYLESERFCLYEPNGRRHSAHWIQPGG